MFENALQANPHRVGTGPRRRFSLPKIDFILKGIHKTQPCAAYPMPSYLIIYLAVRAVDFEFVEGITVIGSACSAQHSNISALPIEIFKIVNPSFSVVGRIKGRPVPTVFRRLQREGLGKSGFPEKSYMGDRLALSQINHDPLGIAVGRRPAGVMVAIDRGVGSVSTVVIGRNGDDLSPG